MKMLMSLALALILGIATPAFAQKVGPNGGKIGGKDDHQTELIVSATELTVYLIEKGKAEPVKNAKIRAVIQQAGKSETVSFADVEGKKLVAKLAAPLAKGAIVVITGKDDHGHSISARYVID